MNNLLDKFDEIEIKNDTRLCEPDRLYCEREHELYVRVLAHFRDMYGELQILKEKDSTFYGSVTENEYYSGDSKYQKYNHTFVELSKKEFKDVVTHAHDRFIERINSYFREKYNVKIETKRFADYARIEEPESPDRGYWGYSKATDEERAEFQRKTKKYEADLEAYTDKIINTNLDYNVVVDEIFLLLGGFSFEEKAENEIKEGAKKSAKRYNGAPDYTLKNGKISFDILSSYKDSIWNEYRVSLDGEGYKALLRALTYFDSNKVYTSIYHDWYSNFVSYKMTDKDGIYDTHKTYKTKVTHFKYYKNGKFEVSFDNHSSALKFAGEYLGYSENKENKVG